MSKNSRERIRYLVRLAVLAAIVIVLQLICTFIKFGPFSITLALAPIIIGAAILGPLGGAVLGAVFGLVVILTGLMGWDGGFVLLLMEQNAFFTLALCLLKGVLAGLSAAAVYRLIAKKSSLAAVFATGAVTPVVNTGLFALGMLTLFSGFLSASAAVDGRSPIALLFLGWIGINFIIELAVNLALGVGITRIIDIVQKKFYKN